ncbi:hypothetical protein SAMN05192574_101826 [Mucilaginibacter gossypiicola]|uniref:Uncharacterized protein n=2 Tax=Mucilaginibacter gossypiicola TaxID=551995 RepID=A0A1H8B9S9_9SPHI|nr:hypothetical protein SAMN05192574_101826 [Mucilaginibacter gossypiicola]
MKKYIAIGLFCICCHVTKAQDHWGPWNPVSCWKGLHFHLSKGDYNTNAKEYNWTCQFKSDYSQPISFTLTLLAPNELAAYKNKTWQQTRLGQQGRITLGAGEDQSTDPKDGFGVQPFAGGGLFDSNTILYVVVSNVRFGDDDHNKPFATDDCGHNSSDTPSGNNSTDNVNIASQTTDVNGVQSNSNNSSCGNMQQTRSSDHIAVNTNVPQVNIHNSDNVTNATHAQTQTYINNAQNPNNDAIQNVLALNQAKINAVKPNGATTGQRLQVQQLQNQQKEANTEAVVQSTGELINSVSNLISQRQQRKDYEKEKNTEIEAIERENNRQAIADGTADPGELVDKGIHSKVSKDYTTANYYFAAAAAMDNISGLCELADDYHFGYGLAQNDATASTLLYRAFDLAQKRTYAEASNAITKTNNAWSSKDIELGYAIRALDDLARSLHYTPSPQNSNIQMSLICRLWIDSLYTNNYIKIFFRSDFSCFISSEIDLANLYEINVDKTKTQIECLKLAVNFYDKTDAMIEKRYTADAARNKSQDYLYIYDKSSYKFDAKRIKSGKDKIIKQLKLLGVNSL